MLLNAHNTWGKERIKIITKKIIHVIILFDLRLDLLNIFNLVSIKNSRKDTKPKLKKTCQLNSGNKPISKPANMSSLGLDFLFVHSHKILKIIKATVNPTRNAL